MQGECPRRRIPRPKCSSQLCHQPGHWVRLRVSEPLNPGQGVGPMCTQSLLSSDTSILGLSSYFLLPRWIHSLRPQELESLLIGGAWGRHPQGREQSLHFFCTSAHGTHSPQACTGCLPLTLPPPSTSPGCSLLPLASQ